MRTYTRSTGAAWADGGSGALGSNQRLIELPVREVGVRPLQAIIHEPVVLLARVVLEVKGPRLGSRVELLDCLGELRELLEGRNEIAPAETMSQPDEVLDQVRHGVLATLGQSEIQQSRAVECPRLARLLVAPHFPHVLALVPQPTTGQDAAFFLDHVIFRPPVDGHPKVGLFPPEWVVQPLLEMLSRVGPEHVLPPMSTVD